MKNGTKALFGGALMACGMSANAQTFVYLDTDYTGAYGSFAQSATVGGPNDVASAPAALDTYSSGYSAAYGTTTMSTSQTPTSFRSEGMWDGTGTAGYGYGIARFQQFFTVTADATLTLTWDVTGTDFFASAIVLRDDVNGGVLANIDMSATPAGSIDIFVDNDLDYAFIGGLINSGFGPFITVANVAQFVEVSVGAVPAPGAMALLGLAGIAGVRRRRA